MKLGHVKEASMRNLSKSKGLEPGGLPPGSGKTRIAAGCFDNVNYSAIQTKGATYSIRDLERALTIPERDHAIIRKWRELAEGRPTVAFCCSIEHANRVAVNFSQAGICNTKLISGSSGS